jgi:hypothetical protein
MERYLKIRRGRGGQTLVEERFSDLPRCALTEVASRFAIGRSAPSFEEGIVPFSTRFPIRSQFYARTYN